MAPLIARLIKNPEDLSYLKFSHAQKLFSWIAEEVVKEKVLSVENWLEVSFHLCKQRWDSSVDWLEQQPMSKVLAMVQVVEDFGRRQEEEMKKSSKR
jgi:hypothetical protein